MLQIWMLLQRSSKFCHIYFSDTSLTKQYWRSTISTCLWLYVFNQVNLLVKPNNFCVRVPMISCSQEWDRWTAWKHCCWYGDKKKTKLILTITTRKSMTPLMILFTKNWLLITQCVSWVTCEWHTRAGRKAAAMATTIDWDTRIKTRVWLHFHTWESH